MADDGSLKNRPIIGLALGGGGARGYAHLGVIKALLEAEIPVDVIAGTSMGALVGAVYATENNIEKAEEIAINIQWSQLLRLIDLTLPSQGIIAGSKVEQYFYSLIGETEFDQLETELVVVTTDIRTEETVYFTKGPVAHAIRASTSLPGIFWPVESDGRRLIDGTITEPVPVQAVADAGAQIIVVVDLDSPVDHADFLFQTLNWWKAIPSQPVCKRLGLSTLHRFVEKQMPQSYHTVVRSLEINSQTKTTTTTRDDPYRFVIQPAVKHVRWFEFQRAPECILAGEAAGKLVVDQIRTLLQKDARHAAIFN